MSALFQKKKKPCTDKSDECSDRHSLALNIHTGRRLFTES